MTILRTRARGTQFSCEKTADGDISSFPRSAWNVSLALRAITIHQAPAACRAGLFAQSTSSVSARFALEVERTISLAGPSVEKPRLLKTRLGASTGDLTEGGTAAELRAFLEVLDTCVLPTFVCAGNHDRQGDLFGLCLHNCQCKPGCFGL